MRTSVHRFEFGVKEENPVRVNGRLFECLMQRPSRFLGTNIF